VRGLFKRLGSALRGDGGSPLDEENKVEAIPPAGAIDGRFATQTAPVGGAVKFLLGTEPSVEEFDETFRQGPIGPWIGSADDSGHLFERVWFQADHTGETIIANAEGELQERCLFEWQEIGDWCIRMRSVAWLAGDEGLDESDWEEGEEDDEEEERPVTARA
jgi:hypothetical protein